MVDNYERIVEKIARLSNVSKDEIERRVEAKRARLSGLISKEGAAQVVASELGISFDNETLKLNELLPGMKKVHAFGKVLKISPIRSFMTKKGELSKVVNFQVADDTSNVKVVLWDTNHIDLVESKKIQEGSVIEIGNGSIRDDEIHLGSFSELKLSNVIINNPVTEKVAREKPIKEFKIGDNASVRAFIVQCFEPRFFYACPQCGKKTVSGPDGFICDTHGKIDARKKAIFNLVIDDGTETMRTVVFNDQLSELGISDLDNQERILNQREELLGREMVFAGNIRNNQFFNTPEFIANHIQKVNSDELIERLEK